MSDQTGLLLGEITQSKVKLEKQDLIEGSGQKLGCYSSLTKRLQSL